MSSITRTLSPVLCLVFLSTVNTAFAQSCAKKSDAGIVNAAPVIEEAVKLLMDGEDGAARGLANNIWLSSAEPEYRRKAWRILILTEPAHQRVPGKVEFKIRAPGARDHDRFKLWLEKQFVGWHEDIDSVHVHYKSVMLTETRLSEDALITFYLDKDFDKSVLIDRINKSHRMPYPTNEWLVVTETNHFH